MTGYVRVDTGNNIADGNVISAADLDNEFDGIQAAFNASTGHNHDGTTGEGAPILVLGPTQDVVVGASTVTPKTTNTVDIGSSSLKFKDLYMAGNASIGGTLGVTGATTLSAALTYGGVTLSNAVTGTGNMVLSASPTLTGTLSGVNASLSGTLAVTGVATLTAQPILSSLTASRAVFTDGSKGLVSNAITGTGNVVMSASPTLTGTITAEALTLSGAVTASGGTANGVAYLNGSKVLTTGSALTFDGTNMGLGNSSPSSYNGTAAQGVLAVGTTSGNRGVNVVSGTTSTGSVLFSDTTNDRGGLIYYHTADVMAFLANGSEQMRLTSTGLGIGTSSPSVKLHAYSGTSMGQITADGTGAIKTGVNFASGGTTYGQIYFDNNSPYDMSVMQQYSTGSLRFGTNNTERARIDSSGNFTIGGQTATRLEVNLTENDKVELNAVDSTNTARNLVFSTGDTERARIDSSGNWLVGTTSALSSFSGARASFVGASGFVAQTNQDASYECGAFWHPATSGNNTFAIFGTEATYTTRGSITYNRGAGLVAYNTTSDYRAKDVSGPLIDSGAVIDSVPVYMGKMKGATQERPMFIAHEVPAYAHTGEKDAVDADGNPVYQQMDASALIPVMWAEIQSLRQRLAAANL